MQDPEAKKSRESRFGSLGKTGSPKIREDQAVISLASLARTT
jgi:hypothetical protein